jgi:tRNA-specific 2-thiouridylase
MSSAIKECVVVAMSGGVDSSVAAALLKQQGYDVIGVTMKTWETTIPTPAARHGCYGPGAEDDIEDARKVALRLGILFHVIDLSLEYKSEVLDYFREEYLSGRTPNPCTRCNPRLKFGALVRKVKESGIEFNYFATGHYARLEYSEQENHILLKKAQDLKKDQSYFLALLSREQLKHALFPLGEYTKPQVRKLASEFGLGVSDKADSQDFVSGDYISLLGPLMPGPILDRFGHELGRHMGIGHHTIGQRKGLGISSAKPLYVTNLDPIRNAVIVGDKEEIFHHSLLASQLNWLAIDRLDRPIKTKARIRYRHQEADAGITPVDEARVYVKFAEPQMAITPGQTIVFYDGDIVVGGGIIEKSEE